MNLMDQIGAVLGDTKGLLRAHEIEHLDFDTPRDDDKDDE